MKKLICILLASFFLNIVNAQQLTQKITNRNKKDSSNYSTLASIGSFGVMSSGTTTTVSGGSDFISKTIYDTTVLYEGEKECKHQFVGEFESRLIITDGTFINGYKRGDSEEIYKEKKICRICLKHIEVREMRIMEKRVDRYQEALEKLKKLQSNK